MAKYNVKLYSRPYHHTQYTDYSGSLKHYLLHKDFVIQSPKTVSDDLKVVNKIDDDTFNQDFINNNTFIHETFYNSNLPIEIETDDPELYNNLALEWKSCNCQVNRIVYRYSLHLII